MLSREDLKEFSDLITSITAIYTKEVLTSDEVAKYLGISKSYLYKLTMRGEIPHYKPIGKLCYFNRKEIESWIQGKELAAEEEETPEPKKIQAKAEQTPTPLAQVLKITDMKVFGCRRYGEHSGGVILVAAYTKEQAIIAAARNKSTKDLFFWWNDEADSKDDNLAKDDGNIKHLHSYVYPPKDWFELNHMHTDLGMPHVILEDGFSE